MSRKKQNRPLSLSKSKRERPTNSLGLCQKCDNMDPEAFKFELFCAMRKILDPATKETVSKAVRLYARTTCLVCENITATIESSALTKAIGI